jgi:hypothetical protein
MMPSDLEKSFDINDVALFCQFRHRLYHISSCRYVIVNMDVELANFIKEILKQAYLESAV